MPSTRDDPHPFDQDIPSALCKCGLRREAEIHWPVEIPHVVAEVRTPPARGPDRRQRERRLIRPSLDDLYMSIATALARRSTCERGQVGALLVRDARIISTGYNGSPPGMAHCTDVGCDELVLWELTPGVVEGPPIYRRVTQGCQRAIHAEVNVLAFAARHGVRAEGCTLYSTCAPCLACARLLLAAGITRVVYAKPYRDDLGLALLAAGGVRVDIVHET